MRLCYKKLFKLLVDKEMKKKELAKKAGVGIATITKMRNGSGSINSDILARICGALNCTLDDIAEVVDDNENNAEI